MSVGKCLLLASALAALAGGGCTKVEYQEDTHFPIDPMDFPPVGPQGMLLVTNSMSDTVSWIDLATDQVVFSEPVGRIAAEREGPHHGAASADGRFFYIGLSNYVPGSGSGPHGAHGTGLIPGWALKYDVVEKRLVGAVQVERNPGDVRLTPDGRFLLQSHFDLVKITEATMQDGWTVEDTYANLAVIDVDEMLLDGSPRPEFVKVCPAPHGIAMTADGSTVYLACYASDELAIVDLTTTPKTVTRVALAGAPSDPTNPQIQPYAVAISPADDKVWVTCPTAAQPAGTLRPYDPATGTFGTPVDTIGKPFFPTFNADGSKLYIPEQGNPSHLTIRDGATGAVLNDVQIPIESCLAPHAVWVNPDETKAYVVCEGDKVGNGTIAVVNVAIPTPAVTTVITVGVFPDDAIYLKP